MTTNAPYKTALRKLARREHSRKELQQALRLKYPDAGDLIDQTLDQLVKSGYLNEERFTEMFIRSRRERGYGPIRIGLELEGRGISVEIMEQYLDIDDPDWAIRMEQVRQKRFGKSHPKDFPEKARQMKFLQYRGFVANLNGLDKFSDDFMTTRDQPEQQEREDIDN